MKADDLSSVTQSRCEDLSSSYYDDVNDTMMGEGTPDAPPLHGRDRERRELLGAYQLVLQTQESQIVFVHGTSGQGKTSLVDTLREPVYESRGYFCTGKFFQDSQTQEPYSAITAAFSDLCDLVVQSPDFDEQSRNRIQERLALYGPMLSRSINLTPFFSVESMDRYAGNEKTATFARFRCACKAFLLAMTSAVHPAVLFIDDVQWMDDGSRKLLEMFIKDDEFKNVMFVFSYRDEEASAVECILPSCPKGGEVADIQLSNLDLSGVRQIVEWQLGSKTPNIDGLSELTLQRTGGNPFYVFLFLEELETGEFVVWNGARPTFDLDKIRRSVMVAESIADCLSQKVKRLPSEIRVVLTVAALIGYSFDEAVLLKVPDILKATTKKKKKVISLLTRAVDEGFIEGVGGGRYQFAHDKVQSAFQGLLDKPTRERFHLLLGKIYVDQCTDGSIYNAAVHLNVAPGFLYSPHQVIVLARFNLEASRHCQQLSAFDKAVSLLRKGINLLDSIKMKWSHETFDLSLELTESLAKTALLVGDFDTCKKAAREVILLADSKEQKVNALVINVECRMAQNDMEGSIKASTEALSELGVKFPKKITMRHVICKFVKLKFLMAKKTDEDILGLPPVEDVSWKASIRLLANITFYACSMHDLATSGYASLLAMDLTLQHGLSAYSGHALANFAAVVLQVGNPEYAYNVGKLSLKLMEKSPSREGDCATIGIVNCGLLHVKEPVCNLRDPLLDAATAGFESGDVIYSTYCISQVFGMDVFAGAHLEALQWFLDSQYCRIQDLGQDELLTWIRPYIHYVANLRSSSTDWHQLSVMYTDHMDRDLLEANNIMVTATILIQKLQLANTFGFHAVARQTFEELEPLGQLLGSVFVFSMVCWAAGDAYYECFIDGGKPSHLRKARKYKKHLKQWCAQGGPNASAFLRHLQLKETLVRVQGRRTWCTKLSHHDDTLRVIERHLQGFSLSDATTPCYVVARAFVDAGNIAERMGRFGEAEQYFEQAREIHYEKWGAFAPAAWLEEKCEALQRKQPQEAEFNTQTSLVGGIVQFGDEE